MTALVTLTQKLAERLDFGLENSDELVNVLKNTAFKGTVTDAQMVALLVVASQYGLNPWTRQIYAFADPKNGVVPIVGVDGWAQIINDNRHFDGMDFQENDESCTCIIYRKDRSHPIKVTEWMSECKRNTGPWNSHPKRMLRHKAMIQCARLAFGLSGIYEQDEAERIIEAGSIDASTGEVKRAEQAPLPDYTEAQFDENKAKWNTALNSGKLTAQALIDTISTKFTLSEKQKTAIRNMEPIDQKEAA